MLGMIELGVEALQRRKVLQFTLFRLRVADRTDRTFLVLELVHVTTNARRVVLLSGKADLCGPGVPPMADQTRKLGVVLVRVIEFRKLGRIGRQFRDRVRGVGPVGVRIRRDRIENRNVLVLRRILHGCTGTEGVTEEKQYRHQNEKLSGPQANDPRPFSTFVGHWITTDLLDPRMACKRPLRARGHLPGFSMVRPARTGPEIPVRRFGPGSEADRMRHP